MRSPPGLRASAPEAAIDATGERSLPSFEPLAAGSRAHPGRGNRGLRRADREERPWLGTGNPVEFKPISRTKITATPVREATLSRERLLDWLRSNLSRRALLIVAEAGYGKTTLLADYARGSETRCLWYKLDSTDADWVTFVNYFVAAMRQVEPAWGRGTLGLLERIAVTDSPRDLVVSTLCAELSQSDDVPTAFILDDFHAVDASEEIGEILGRLFEHAPPSWSFVLSTRRLPALPLARLTAQGEVARLDTQALRFSRDETERLFSEAFKHPLEADIVDQVDARTEGWVASLQLLYSSIRGRSPLEIRAFVRAMSGAEGPLYDFLAQELLHELPAELRRFLVHASLLERVVAGHVEAMFASEPEPPSLPQIDRWINEAEGLGLLSKRGEGSTSRRFHPLLQEFLRSRLSEIHGQEAVRGFHHRVAAAAEATDWLTACHHFIEAGQLKEAMRVLGGSVLVALGTGQWGPAGELIERLGGEEPDAGIQVMGALRQMELGRADSAMKQLIGLSGRDHPPYTRALIRHARYRGYWMLGDDGGVDRVISDALDDPETPQVFREIAEMHFATYTPDDRPQNLRLVSARLQDLATTQERAGLTYFAGISLHNAMLAEFYRAEYALAVDLGMKALMALEQTATAALETPGTHATIARALAELGRSEESLAHRLQATSDGVTDPDGLTEAAYLATSQGHSDEATVLIERAHRLADAPRPAPAQTSLVAAQAQLALALGNPGRALEFVRGAGPARGIGARLASKTQEAIGLHLTQDQGSGMLIQTALAEARADGAHHWIARLEVVDAARRDDAESLTIAVRNAAFHGAVALPELADVVAGRLHLLHDWAEVAVSIKGCPDRWLPALRRQLASGSTPAGHACVAALAEHGEIVDIPRIRAFERTYRRPGRGLGLAKRLARQASPVVQIHDLGRGWCQIDDRRVDVVAMRRKAAALLVYMLSRRNGTITKEQVLDSLWPDLTPDGASNSLSQTLYFLRREIDPWYDDQASMDYIRAEGELLWLDEDKVVVDSRAFEAAAFEVGRTQDSALGLAAIKLYCGRFAPEFEYEEWAAPFRERLHASYLRIAHMVQELLIGQERLDEAANVARHALSIDPEALDLEVGLVRLYSSMGAASAAAEQYAHYATAHREQHGGEPPTLSEILGR